MRRNILVMLSALLFMALMVAASPAQAQVTVNNNTACAIVVCPPRSGGCVTIPPNSSVLVNISCATSARIMLCNQAIAVPPGGCLRNVQVGVGCCADVCFDVVNCTVDITPTAGPCPCR